ncbi:Transforming acidic coiled-coil-containing protein 2 [Terramyces sp. JEL0728]|nr:Transforming acidic coiled-coil-containing protein 2 [Terramyces sp. JEL0728]
MDTNDEMDESQQSSGLWGILPSWTTPKKNTPKKRTNSFSGLEESPKPVIHRSASTMILSTPRETERKKEDLKGIDLTAEQYGAKEPVIKKFTPKKQQSLDEIMRTPRLSIGGMVTSKFSLQSEDSVPPKQFEAQERSFFMEDLLNETIEDLENVGLPFSETEHTPDDSEPASHAGSPLNQKSFFSKLQGVSKQDKDFGHESIVGNAFSDPKADHVNPEKEHLQSKLTLEFDPLIPKDWMMSFDSPNPVQKVKGISASQPTAPEHKLSLLDTFEPMSSPNSAFRYNKHDLDRLERDITTKFEKEFALAQEELNEMSNKNQALVEENCSMQATLLEWEKAVKSMIADKEKEHETLSGQITHLEGEKTEYLRVIENQKNETDELHLKYKQLRLDLTDLREVNEGQKEIVAKTKDELSVANARFDKLRNHAESKLEEANIEIARVRASYEKELIATRSKVSRLECQINNLERNLEGKNTENEELMRICDGLEKQLL